MEPDTRPGAEATTRREEDDRRWPRPVRVLVTALVVPVCAAAILAAENDFGFLGSWFDPLMIGLMLGTVIVAWAATARSQR
jgi:hypothetical protein